jgi:glutathione synthase/RimK-type ligase-like ATP-grasp enzyme
VGDPFVLIISCFYEANVNKVVERLASRGIRWFRLNTETIPLVARARLQYSSTGPTYALLTTGDTQVDSREVTSVWFRREGDPVLAQGLEGDCREFARQESIKQLYGFYDFLGCKWVNDYASEYKASNKPYQLLVAREVGLSIPETLMTNDPLAVKDFHESNGGRTLFKSFGSSMRSGRNEFATQVREAYAGKFAMAPELPCHESGGEHKYLLFAQLLDSEKLRQIDSIITCPLIFQKYVEKHVDIRVTVVGDAVFSAAIYSQEYEGTKVDFRSQVLQPPDKMPRHVPFQLPASVEEKVMALMRRLGLLFGCIDILLTPDGDFVFLEVNPAGQWGWIENRADLKITDALVDLLIS